MKFNLKSLLTYVVVMLVLFSCFSIGKYIHYPPHSIHQWAQSDRASIALNYYQDGMDFFHPRVHNLSNGTGITGLEFPIVNYLAAFLYKIFGYDDFLYRLLMTLIVTTGLFFAFKLVNSFLKNIYLSIFIILIFFLSPVLVYYTPNFIPDAASFGLILVSWYYFFSYTRESKKYQIIIFTITAALACLIKITSLISVITIVILLILDGLNFFKQTKIHKKFSMYLSSLIIFIAVISWYKYAEYINETYKAWFFMLEFRPLSSLSMLSDLGTVMIRNWGSHYYSSVSFIFFTILFIVVIRYFKSGNILLNVITALLFLGGVSFILLMFTQFPDHDYYIITLLPFILFLLLSSSIIIAEKFQLNPNLLGIVLMVILFYNIVYCRSNYLDRVTFKLDENYYGNYKAFQKYYNIEPYLNEIGVKSTDKIASIFDESPNITLYLSNRKGYTISYKASENDIRNIILQSDYVIINYENVLMYPSISSLIHKAGEKNGLLIYKVSK